MLALILAITSTKQLHDSTKQTLTYISLSCVQSTIQKQDIDFSVVPHFGDTAQGRFPSCSSFDEILSLLMTIFSSFFAVTVFLNQNVSHYVSFLTNKRFLFIKSNQFRSTNSRNMINDSYIGYDKFLPEQFILYKRIVKVDLFAMYCLLRLQLPNRSQLMQQYMNHKTHPEMMSSTLVK